MHFKNVGNIFNLSLIFKVFGLKTMFFELLQAKPCRTITKLFQKLNLEPETCEIIPKL